MITKGLTIAQEASFGQVVVVKLDNFYRNRPAKARKLNRQDERLAAPTLLIFVHVRYVCSR